MKPVSQRNPHQSRCFQSIRNRYVSRLIVAVVLGALTTYAVAWACCSVNVHGGGPTWMMGLSHHTSPTWQVYEYDRFGSTVVQSRGYYGALEEIPPDRFLNNPVPYWSMARRPPEEIVEQSHDISAVEVLENARGWPMRAVISVSEWGGVATRWRISMNGAIEVPASVPYIDTLIAPIMSTHMLPYAPIWPGMIINTLLYSVMWLLLWLAARTTRRTWRRRRGRCSMCGYDLQGTADGRPCPECGHVK